MSAPGFTAEASLGHARKYYIQRSEQDEEVMYVGLRLLSRIVPQRGLTPPPIWKSWCLAFCRAGCRGSSDPGCISDCFRDCG
jgi:hypothetical protein